MQRERSRRRWAGLALVLLTIGLRWNSITMPFERDEGEYVYGAHLLFTGGVSYRDDFMQKPPMILYTYAVAELVTPDTLGPRALAFGSLVATALVLAALLVATYGETASAVGALAFIMFT